MKREERDWFLLGAILAGLIVSGATCAAVVWILLGL
jgi:hypothetical protein